MVENKLLNNGPQLEPLSRDNKSEILNNTSVKKENSATVAMEDGETISPSWETLEKNKSSNRSNIRAKIIKNLVSKKVPSSSKYSKK